MSCFVNKSYVNAAHKEGVKVNVWTVNPEERIKYMIDCGVDGIITDCPDRALNILKKTGV
jgi:glycerophosphoryl diester phosphodiesterase